jgi:hypothetical protein
MSINLRNHEMYERERERERESERERERYSSRPCPPLSILSIKAIGGRK